MHIININLIYSKMFHIEQQMHIEKSIGAPCYITWLWIRLLYSVISSKSLRI